MSNLTIDTTDLRGSTLIKIRNNDTKTTVMFGYYRDSSGYEGKLILPPNSEIDAKLLQEIIRVLVAAYPKVGWKVLSEPEEDAHKNYGGGE